MFHDVKFVESLIEVPYNQNQQYLVSVVGLIIFSWRAQLCQFSQSRGGPFSNRSKKYHKTIDHLGLTYSLRLHSTMPGA
jgi:hypothetical protein